MSRLTRSAGQLRASRQSAGLSREELAARPRAWSISPAGHQPGQPGAAHGQRQAGLVAQHDGVTMAVFTFEAADALPGPWHVTTTED